MFVALAMKHVLITGMKIRRKSMAKKYECFDCGKIFQKAWERMLHESTVHLGEPVVRPVACICAGDIDIRNGTCPSCGYVMSAGWVTPSKK
jgi:hypothetical protein